MTKDALLEEIQAAKEVAWAAHSKGRSHFLWISFVNLVAGAVTAGSSAAVLAGTFGAAALPIITGLAAAVSILASGWLVVAKPREEASKGEAAAAELELVRDLLRNNALTVEQAIGKYNEIQRKYPLIVESAMTASRAHA